MTANEHIRALHCLLEVGEDFGEIRRYFYDHLAESPAFLGMGKRKKNTMLRAVVRGAAQRYLDPSVRAEVALFRIRRHGMWHGAIRAGAHGGDLFYFESSEMGLVSLSSSATRRVEYVRFRAAKFPPGAVITAPQYPPSPPN